MLSQDGFCLRKPVYIMVMINDQIAKIMIVNFSEQ